MQGVHLPQSLPIRPRRWTHHMLGECSASLVLGLAAAAIEPVVVLSLAEPLAVIPPGAVLKQITGSVAAVALVNLQQTTMLLVRHWIVGLAAAALRLQDSTPRRDGLLARGISVDGMRAIHEIERTRKRLQASPSVSESSTTLQSDVHRVLELPPVASACARETLSINLLGVDCPGFQLLRCLQEQGFRLAPNARARTVGSASVRGLV